MLPSKVRKGQVWRHAATNLRCKIVGFISDVIGDETIALLGEDGSTRRAMSAEELREQYYYEKSMNAEPGQWWTSWHGESYLLVREEDEGQWRFEGGLRGQTVLILRKESFFTRDGKTALNGWKRAERASARLTYDEAKAKAEAEGGRLPTKEETEPPPDPRDLMASLSAKAGAKECAKRLEPLAKPRYLAPGQVWRIVRPDFIEESVVVHVKLPQGPGTGEALLFVYQNGLFRFPLRRPDDALIGDFIGFVHIDISEDAVKTKPGDTWCFGWPQPTREEAATHRRMLANCGPGSAKGEGYPSVNVGKDWVVSNPVNPDVPGARLPREGQVWQDAIGLYVVMRIDREARRAHYYRISKVPGYLQPAEVVGGGIVGLNEHGEIPIICGNPTRYTLSRTELSNLQRDYDDGSGVRVEEPSKCIGSFVGDHETRPLYEAPDRDALIRALILEEAKNPPPGIGKDAWLSFLSDEYERTRNEKRARGRGVTHDDAKFIALRIKCWREHPPKSTGLEDLQKTKHPRGWWDR